MKKKTSRATRLGRQGDAGSALNRVDFEAFHLHHRLKCFFFQAEDGIRDLYVTGVQTCALPISSSCLTVPRTSISGPGASPPPGSAIRSASTLTRSEERRVGKECRSRWSPY